MNFNHGLLPLLGGDRHNHLARLSCQQQREKGSVAQYSSQRRSAAQGASTWRLVNEVRLDLGLGGHDLQTIFQRFAKYGEKKYIEDFQTNRKHQGFDFFGSAEQLTGHEVSGHSPKSLAEDTESLRAPVR